MTKLTRNNIQIDIGIETHIQLNTKSKLFSGASTALGVDANIHACAIDIALPGVLPVLNKAAVEKAIIFGKSIKAKINQRSIFARKNYFYPDLPKGYQISQHTQPIVIGGHLDIILDDGSIYKVNIERAHLEEDAGKSLHEEFHNQTGIDLNRAGTPLLEIVTHPILRNPKETINYLKTLHSWVRYLKISTANMQDGAFRCDLNISLRPIGQKNLGTKVEIKNVNSFKSALYALEYEIDRQLSLLNNNQKVKQQTRLYDAVKNITRSMRDKENAHDYRYFPEPDLLPVNINQVQIDELTANLPPTVAERFQKFSNDYNLNLYDAKLLTQNLFLADYFEIVISKTNASAKLVANWITGELLGALNKDHLNIQKSPINAENLAELLNFIHNETISGKIAKDVFAIMWTSNKKALEIIKEKGLQQITDDNAISEIISKIIAANPKQTLQYRNGKTNLFGYFVGQTMKATQGKANPQKVAVILKKQLNQE